MKKIKIFRGALLFFILLFSIKVAKADSPYDYPHTFSDVQVTGGTLDLHNITSTSTLENIQLRFGMDGTIANCTGGSVTFDMVFDSGLYSISSSTRRTVLFHELTEFSFDLEPFNVTFAQFADVTVSVNVVSYNVPAPCVNAALKISGSNPTLHPTDYVGFWDGLPPQTVIPYITFNGSATATSIVFRSPTFTDNMTTPDFLNWNLCLNVAVPHYFTGFNFKVTYGTSTPYGNIDNYANDYGQAYVPLSSDRGLINNCLLLTKTASSTPGAYQAIGTLYDQSGATITQTSLLHINITTGERVPLPNNSNQGGLFFDLPSLPECGDTAFELLGVDFGYGMCRIIMFFVKPHDWVIAEYNQTFQVVQQTPLISAYQSLIVEFQTSTTSSSTLSFTYNTTSTPIQSINVPLKASVVNMIGQSSFDFIRAMIVVAIYFSFVVYIIFRLKNFF